LVLLPHLPVGSAGGGRAAPASPRSAADEPAGWASPSPACLLSLDAGRVPTPRQWTPEPAPPTDPDPAAAAATAAALDRWSSDPHLWTPEPAADSPSPAPRPGRADDDAAAAAAGVRLDGPLALREGAAAGRGAVADDVPPPRSPSESSLSSIPSVSTPTILASGDGRLQSLRLDDDGGGGGGGGGGGYRGWGGYGVAGGGGGSRSFSVSGSSPDSFFGRRLC
jgi:hypothetical protein